jgi:Skp family chaperone for outer membrane proteins
VKKTWIIAAGMLALSGAIVVCSKLVAQPARPAAAAQTKIGLINLSAVIKKYNKYVAFQNEVNQTIATYQDKDKKYRDELEKAKKTLANPSLSDKDRDGWEKYGKAQQRLIEDNQNEAKAAIGKKGDEQMVILYKEVREACQRYAESQGLEMVLHYNDAPLGTPEFDSPANVARKMQAGACMPVYVANGMDISNEILKMLNDKYGPVPTPAVTPTNGGATTPKPSGM